MKTALITGASRGLGEALAEALSRRAYRLILDARGAEALQEVGRRLLERTEVEIIPGDIADPEHRAELARAARRLGGLDVLVNNAGILGPSPQPALVDYPLDVLEHVFRINVVAQLGVVQALRPTFNDGVRILNVSSDAAVEAYPGWGGYGSAKAGFEQLSAVLAAENPKWRVYTVDPGDMRTQMHQAAFPGEDISDRPLPGDSVPGLLRLVDGELDSGRYRAGELAEEETR